MTNRGSGYNPRKKKPSSSSGSSSARAARAAAVSAVPWSIARPNPGGRTVVVLPDGTVTTPTAPSNPYRGGGGGGDGGASAAEARAVARENAAKRAAGTRSREMAANLEGQAKALLHALSDEGFKKALDQNLQDVLRNWEAQSGQLKQGFTERMKNFEGAISDTEQATAAQEGTAFENLVRERQDTMATLLSQGAGETDALRAMVMSARQWRDNSADASRNYFDTARSIDTGITDLVTDTRTALSNGAMALEGERERLWQDYYNRRSQSYTELGNIRQQQADYYAQADEMEVESTSDQNTAKGSASDAFMNAAKEMGKSYVQQGVPDWITKYGADAERPEMKLANTDLAAAMRFEPVQKAEGAALRRWG